MSIVKSLIDIGLAAAIPVGILGGALIFGGPSTPPPLNELAAEFDAVDRSGAPGTLTFTARDGAALAYRRYGEGAGRVVVILHGSGGSGIALHTLADAVAATGREVYVPDIRGHGESGVRGDVDHIGQAEEDIADLLSHIAASGPVTLAGFSMGGGLALKYAASGDARIGDVALVSPYLAHDAPPMTVSTPYASERNWAEAGVPRIIGLSALNSVGVTALNGMEVIRLATRPQDADAVASAYSYRLIRSVNPDDWAGDMAALGNRLTLIVSDRDELHALEGYRQTIARHAPDARLIAVDGESHIGLTLAPAGIGAFIEALEERS